MKISGIEPLFDIHPVTGACIEVFYADNRLVTFGRGGSGWFWWFRQRGLAPDNAATGPFATSYAAYRHAMRVSRGEGDPLVSARKAGDAKVAHKGPRPLSSVETQVGTKL